MREVTLQPGETLFSREPMVMRTQLGSCVSLTLWHPRHHWGGMCHFMLPSRRHRDRPLSQRQMTRQRSDSLNGKYADEALAILLQGVAKTGSAPGEYVVKLFGGGNMFPQLGGRHAPDIASQNVAAAWALVRAQGLDVSAHDLGGTGHRALIFELNTGHVWVRHSPLIRDPERVDERRRTGQ